MRLVHHRQEVSREVVDQAGRSVTGATTTGVQGVVLDAGARPDLTHHLDIKVRALLQSLSLQELPRRAKQGQLLSQLSPDRRDHPFDRRAAGHIVACRIDGRPVECRNNLARERIEASDTLHLVTPKLDADGLFLICRKDLDRVSAHSKRAALKEVVVAPVLDVDEPTQDLFAGLLLPHREMEHQASVVDRVTETEDARHRRDHDHVLPLHQRGRCTKPQPLDVFVDRRILLDERVGRRDVRLGLVVVVVRDEVLDRIVGEERLQLSVQLSRERLVV